MKNNTHDVQLPNGVIYQDVPVGLSKASLLEIGLKNGDITPQEIRDTVPDYQQYSSMYEKYEPTAPAIRTNEQMLDAAVNGVRVPINTSTNSNSNVNQGAINRARLANAVSSAVDTVGPAIQLSGQLYDKATDALSNVPVVGAAVPLIRGMGRGLSSNIEGLSQGIYEVGGQLVGGDPSAQLRNIREFRSAGEESLQPYSEQSPITTGVGKFIGNVAPYAVSPSSIPGLIAAGGLMGATTYQESPKAEHNKGRLIDTLVGSATAPLGAVGTRAAINYTNRGIHGAMDTLRSKVDDVANIPSFLQRPTKVMAKVANVMEDIQGALTGGKMGIAPESKTAMRKAAQSNTEALTQQGLDFGGDLVRPVKGAASVTSYIPTALTDLLTYGVTGHIAPVASVMKLGSNIKPVREVRAALRQGDSLEQVGPLMKKLPVSPAVGLTELLTGQSQ